MKADVSKTILTISTGFLVIYLVLAWKWAIIVSLILGFIGITSPFLSEKIDWFWIKISELLGMVFPKIILSLVFFLFLFPISLLYRIFNKDPLMLSKKYDTYFLEVNKEITKKSFENVW
jgi:hypothetical protein